MERPVLETCPLLMPAAFLAMGIALGVANGAAGQRWAVALLLAAVLLTLLERRWPLVQSAGIWTCFLVLGMVVAPGQEEHVPDGVWTEAVVASPTVEKPKTLKTDLLLTATGERRCCYIWKDERSLQLGIGDNLMVCFRDSLFVSRDGWQHGGDAFNQLSSLQRLRLRALQWRATLLQRLNSGSGDDDAQAVMAAMVLGDKSALTKELRATYSATGASHVLALSGLHLGIIYLLLTRLTQRRRHLLLSQVVIVLGIWAFALLTGLSASVVRAATMISIYAVFSLGGRGNAPLAVLSFTALVMLLVNSRSLYDIGFQLSFMAMLAILLVSPLMGRLVTPRWMMRHRLKGWLLSMTVISLAAQAGTAPLVAYHFGRFSTYFLLTNFVVIPAATLILYGAVVALAIPATAPVLLWLVGLLNAVLAWMSEWPMASIEGLHPTLLQVAMTYVLEGLVVYSIGRFAPVKEDLPWEK